MSEAISGPPAWRGTGGEREPAEQRFSLRAGAKAAQAYVLALGNPLAR